MLGVYQRGILWKMVENYRLLGFEIIFGHKSGFSIDFQGTVILRLLFVFHMSAFLGWRRRAGLQQPIFMLGKWAAGERLLSAVSPHLPVLSSCWKGVELPGCCSPVRGATRHPLWLVLSVMVLKTPLSTPSQALFITRKKDVVLCWQRGSGLLSDCRWPQNVPLEHKLLVFTRLKCLSGLF